MKKIVIVDDEGPIREWLEMCVEKAGSCYMMVGSYRNGEEALQSLQHTKPDIVLTDIVMPKMDGLEFLKKLRLRYSDIKIVILTSHHDFEFARTAIKNGADDYLLKTELDGDSILKVLEKLSESIDQEREQSLDKSSEIDCLSRGQYLRNAIKNPHQLLTKEEMYNHNIMLEDASFFVVSFRADLKVIENSILFTNEVLYNPFMFTDKTGDIILVANIKETINKDRVLRNIVSALRKIVLLKSNVGISRVYRDTSHLLKAIEEAVHMREFLFYDPEEQYDYSTQIPLNMAAKNRITEYKNDVLASHKTIGKSKSQVIIHKMMAYIRKMKICDTEFIIRTVVNMIEQLYYLDTTLDINIQRVKNDMLYSSNINILDKRVQDFIALLKSEKKYSKNIENAIRFIMDHYKSPISLVDVAKAVGFNEDYFSRLFKKETGINYTEYVNKMRMIDAKRYVKTTDLQVNEIANKIGIHNSAYFTQLFKKEFGVSPSVMRMNK